MFHSFFFNTRQSSPCPLNIQLTSLFFVALTSLLPSPLFPSKLLFGFLPLGPFFAASHANGVSWLGELKEEPRKTFVQQTFFWPEVVK